MGDATDLSPEERGHLKKTANAWIERYQAALGRLAQDPHATLDQFISAAWTLGILDQVSPTDPAQQEARERLGKTLWMPRTNPVPYWRIHYLLERTRASIEDTVAIDGISFAVMELMRTLYQMSRSRLTSFFPKLARHHGWPWYVELCERLIERARQALRDLDVRPHDPALRTGSTGVFMDITCEIAAITDDGMLYLQPQEFSFRDASVLVKAMGRRGQSSGICPSQIDYALFTPATK